MNFGEFLLKENEQHDAILQVIKNLAARKKNLPMPTQYLDDGQDAVVFDTVDPDVVVRVGRKECEYTMAEPELQETGGVAEIYFISTIDIGGEDWVVDWKEKVDTNVEGFLYRLMKQDEKMANAIIGVLISIYLPQANLIRALSKFPITKPLYDAIMAGLPTNDLAIQQNLGINKKGCIVAYDC
jgi:hypothetical protein